MEVWSFILRLYLLTWPLNFYILLKNIGSKPSFIVIIVIYDNYKPSKLYFKMSSHPLLWFSYKMHHSHINISFQAIHMICHSFALEKLFYSISFSFWFSHCWLSQLNKPFINLHIITVQAHPIVQIQCGVMKDPLRF